MGGNDEGPPGSAPKDSSLSYWGKRLILKEKRLELCELQERTRLDRLVESKRLNARWPS